jgi:hypothetical protein
MICQKACTDVAAAGPDDPARLDVPEIVQRNFESRGDNVAIVYPKPDSGIADIAQGAREYATLRAGEDQRSVRRLQSFNLPSLSHIVSARIRSALKNSRLRSNRNSNEHRLFRNASDPLS